MRGLRERVRECVRERGVMYSEAVKREMYSGLINECKSVNECKEERRSECVMCV